MTARIDALRQAIEQRQTPAMLVTDPLSLRYLAGFSGDVGLLFVTPGETVLVVDPRYTEQARQEVSGAEIVETRQSWADALAATATRLGLRSLAVEADHVTVRQWDDWRKAAADVEFSSLSGIVAELRSVKAPEEIAAIEVAVALTDTAFAAFHGWLRPGVTEAEAAWFIETYMRTHGAESVAFELIVAGGANGAMAHARPGAHRIQAGEPVVVDIGARVNGYNSDLTRTLWAGPVDDRFGAIYDLVLEAQLAAEAGIRAGMTGKEADAIARRVIEAAGYAQEFGHGLGHGVGLAIHEGPRLSSLASGQLQPGHVVTVEPGVYIPGWGGVRIEDMAVVTGDGLRILTQASKEPWFSL
ncbi:MAG: M24 family metallopeptidase [Anaerolineae bacterium]